MTRTRKNPLEMAAPTQDASMKVIPLERRYEPKTKLGRPGALKFPPLPAEIMEAMTELEREHFDFFIAAIQADNVLRPSDFIGLTCSAGGIVIRPWYACPECSPTIASTTRRRHMGGSWFSRGSSPGISVSGNTRVSVHTPHRINSCSRNKTDISGTPE